MERNERIAGVDEAVAVEVALEAVAIAGSDRCTAVRALRCGSWSWFGGVKEEGEDVVAVSLAIAVDV